jgi:hypothetical protein
MTTLTHEDFCTPSVGEPGPRIESYRAERTNDRGHVTSRPLVTRCIECGAQEVQG